MASDNRQVVLLKSVRTLNRFYVLASPEQGWKNAEEIEDFPDGVLLGIAYPCLEDGLNDFAVIRSTFDTIDCFPDDQELRDEMMVIVLEARDTLYRRMNELRDRLASRQAHFLGTDLNEFKSYALNLAHKGNTRGLLDDIMKLDVFESVAIVDAEQEGAGDRQFMYYYEFRPENALELIQDLPPLEFVVRMFEDVINAAMDEASYESKYTFDKFVFQKFIALMFINYATTDPIFYGTNKADYGVAAGKDMSETPLYRAVAEALREIERMLAESPNTSEEDLTKATQHNRPDFTGESPTQVPPLPVETDFAQGSGAGATFRDLTMQEEKFGDAALFGEDDDEPVFDLSSPSNAPRPTETPMPPPMAANPPSGSNGRTVQLPNATTTEQRIMVPLNSITMAAELLKNSGVPMAATYAQMITASAEALVAALKEWHVLENP
jgi:hypothetical protein